MDESQKYSSQELEEQLKKYEELVRLRTRQLFVIMAQSQEVLKESSLHRQLLLCAQAIVDCRLFRRAVISLFDKNWNRLDVGYAGFSENQVRRLKRSKPLPEQLWRNILSDENRVSESFYIPHNSELNAQIGGIDAESSVDDFDGWHPDDFLFVPLKSRHGRIFGIISVDEPFDGKKPNPRSESTRLLELFAREAASLIERSRLHHKFREQERYLSKIINNTADIIVSADAQGRVHIYNPAAEKCFGYKKNEIIRSTIARLYKNPADARNIKRKMLANDGVIQNEEVLLVSKSGEIIPVELTASMLYDDAGREMGTVGVSRDLRPIKELQARLDEVRKREIVQKTAISLAHHVHNQLMAQVAVLTHLKQDILTLPIDAAVAAHLADMTTKAQERSFQISNIVRTLQNPPEVVTEVKYIDDIDMIALPTCSVEMPHELTDTRLRPYYILIADDEPVLREGFAEYLRHFGIKVDTAEDGAVAIELISHNEYDLIISDIKMPHATGYDVFRAAREKNPALQVVLMTAFGYDPDHTIVKASREGQRGIFFKEKPFDLSRLLELVDKILDVPKNKSK